MLKLLHILPGAFESDRWQVGCPFFLFFTVPCNFVIALQGLCLENILGWHFYCWCLRRPTPLFCHWSRYRERLVTSSSPAFHSPETSLFSLCWSRERELTQRFQQGHKISAVAKMYSWKMLRSKESQRSSWQGTKVSAVLHFTCLIKALRNGKYTEWLRIIGHLVSVQLSHSVVSDSLQPHGMQHASLPCVLRNPGAYSTPCSSY